jgi:putative endonuclease
MRTKGGSVCILASESGVLYTGVTNRLTRRTIEHRQKLLEGFTKKYNITRLVHRQRFGEIGAAIAREKQIKGWLRAKKVALIESTNPGWIDLVEGHFPLKRDQPYSHRTPYVAPRTPTSSGESSSS